MNRLLLGRQLRRRAIFWPLLGVLAPTLFPGVACAQNAPAPTLAPLPQGGKLLTSDLDLNALRLSGARANTARLSVVNAPGAPFSNAIRVETTQRTGDVHDVMVDVPVKGPINSGDVIFVRFWTRVTATTAENGSGRVNFSVHGQDGRGLFFQRGATPALNAGWEVQNTPIPARLNGLEGGHLRLRFGNTGTGTQTIEIGGIEVWNYGKTVSPNDLPFTRITYRGREADAQWRQDALARIEKHRKGDLQIEVVDGAGKPVAGAQIEANLRRHDFLFGTMVNKHWFDPQNTAPGARRYQEAVPKYFNHVALTHYWAFEGRESWGKLERAYPLLAANNLTARAHTALWPGWSKLPASLKTGFETRQKTEGDEAAKTWLRAQIDARLAEFARGFKGRVLDADWVNETRTNNDLMRILGPDALGSWFKRGRELWPDGTLYLCENSIENAGGPTNALLETVQKLQREGAPVGGIAIQGHVGGAFSVEGFVANLDRIAALGLPLQITEYDYVTPDEELQADITRDMVIASYANPQVEGFTMWGFWDGQHWLHDGPIFRRDWSEKAAGKAWRTLKDQTWNTRAKGQSAANGVWRTRGFEGDYEIKVTHAGKTRTARAKLPRDGAKVRVSLD